MLDCCAVGGVILRGGVEPVIGPRIAQTGWCLLGMRSETPMVRGAAKSRVSNRDAAELGLSYVLAVPVNQRVITTAGAELRADAAIAALPAQAWRTRSAGSLTTVRSTPSPATRTGCALASP